MCLRPVTLGNRCQVLKKGLHSYSRNLPLATAKSGLGLPIEEERCVLYDSKTFYPARVGETLGANFKLISKLGWGTGSTVWLAGRNPRLATLPIGLHCGVCPNP